MWCFDGHLPELYQQAFPQICGKDPRGFKMLQPMQHCHYLINLNVIERKSSMNLLRRLGKSTFTVYRVDEG